MQVYRICDDLTLIHSLSVWWQCRITMCKSNEHVTVTYTTAYNKVYLTKHYVLKLWKILKNISSILYREIGTEGELLVRYTRCNQPLETFKPAIIWLHLLAYFPIALCAKKIIRTVNCNIFFIRLVMVQKFMLWIPQMCTHLFSA
jgi:hypothetical protein